MIIGIPKEVKGSEYRVAITPEGAHDLAAPKKLTEDLLDTGAACIAYETIEQNNKGRTSYKKVAEDHGLTNFYREFK